MPVGKHYDLDTDITLASNSDNTIASQKATKAYVDNNYVPNSALEEAATVAKTGDYNDLINKPTIPTVNNATITIQKNSTTVDSFTLNQSSNKSINITVPTTAVDVGAVSTTDGVTGVVAGSTADKINVTKNGSTSTITVNNVANATEATQVTTEAATSNSDRVVYFAHGSSTKKLVYDEDFKYNPSTNKLTVNNIDGKINGDNYINWGGPNLSGNMSPSDAGCLDENGHNKAVFFAGKITTEYSTDGGVTWTDPHVLTDAEKFGLTTKGSYQVRIGNVGSSGVITAENVTNYLARLTISSRNTSGSSAFYTSMKKLILNVSTNGATGTTVKVETRTIANYNNNVDSWSTRGTYNVGGWSGYNSIPCSIAFGGGTTQTSQIADLRLTLSATGASSTSTNNFSVFEIKIIGVTNWGVNSFAYTGHIYDFDKDKNVTFPNKVTAATGGFVGNLTGTADKATKDENGNTITTTYATKSETQTALDAKANKTNIINGAPLSNTSSYFFATSSTAAATVQKEVSIPSITELNVGQIIIVKPTVTSTVANSTIKLNNFDAYPMRYNNAAITTSTDSVVWSASYPSIWVFDGNYWLFAGHGVDSNTTYSNMSVAEGTTGTATSQRTMRADYLKQIIQGTVLTGLDTTTATVIDATDTILSALGKLQAQIDEQAYAATFIDWDE